MFSHSKESRSVTTSSRSSGNQSPVVDLTHDDDDDDEPKNPANYAYMPSFRLPAAENRSPNIYSTTTDNSDLLPSSEAVENMLPTYQEVVMEEIENDDDEDDDYEETVSNSRPRKGKRTGRRSSQPLLSPLYGLLSGRNEDTVLEKVLRLSKATAAADNARCMPLDDDDDDAVVVVAAVEAQSIPAQQRGEGERYGGSSSEAEEGFCRRQLEEAKRQSLDGSVLDGIRNDERQWPMSDDDGELIRARKRKRPQKPQHHQQQKQKQKQHHEKPPTRVRIDHSALDAWNMYQPPLKEDIMPLALPNADATPLHPAGDQTRSITQSPEVTVTYPDKLLTVCVSWDARFKVTISMTPRGEHKAFDCLECEGICSHITNTLGTILQEKRRHPFAPHPISSLAPHPISPLAPHPISPVVEIPPPPPPSSTPKRTSPSAPHAKKKMKRPSPGLGNALSPTKQTTLSLSRAFASPTTPSEAAQAARSPRVDDVQTSPTVAKRVDLHPTSPSSPLDLTSPLSNDVDSDDTFLVSEPNSPYQPPPASMTAAETAKATTFRSTPHRSTNGRSSSPSSPLSVSSSSPSSIPSPSSASTLPVISTRLRPRNGAVSSPRVINTTLSTRLLPTYPKDPLLLGEWQLTPFLVFNITENNQRNAPLWRRVAALGVPCVLSPLTFGDVVVAVQVRPKPSTAVSIDLDDDGETTTKEEESGAFDDDGADCFIFKTVMFYSKIPRSALRPEQWDRFAHAAKMMYSERGISLLHIIQTTSTEVADRRVYEGDTSANGPHALLKRTKDVDGTALAVVQTMRDTRQALTRLHKSKSEDPSVFPGMISQTDFLPLLLKSHSSRGNGVS